MAVLKTIRARRWPQSHSAPRLFLQRPSSSRVASGLARSVGDRGGRASAQNTLDCQTWTVRKRASPGGGGPQRLASLSFQPVSVRARPTVGATRRTPALSSQSVSARRRWGESASRVLCRRPKHSQRKGRIAIVHARACSAQGASHPPHQLRREQATTLLRREQATIVPSCGRESHSRCARVRATRTPVAALGVCRTRMLVERCHVRCARLRPGEHPAPHSHHPRRLPLSAEDTTHRAPRLSRACVA